MTFIGPAPFYPSNASYRIKKFIQTELVPKCAFKKQSVRTITQRIREPAYTYIHSDIFIIY